MRGITGQGVAEIRGTHILNGGTCRDHTVDKIFGDGLTLYGIDDCLIHRHLIAIIIFKIFFFVILLIRPGHVPEDFRILIGLIGFDIV